MKTNKEILKENKLGVSSINTYSDKGAKSFSTLDAMKQAQVEVLHEVAKRWHTNKLQRSHDEFKTLDEIILEVKKEVINGKV